MSMGRVARTNAVIIVDRVNKKIAAIRYILIAFETPCWRTTIQPVPEVKLRPISHLLQSFTNSMAVSCCFNSSSTDFFTVDI